MEKTKLIRIACAVSEFVNETVSTNRTQRFDHEMSYYFAHVVCFFACLLLRLLSTRAAFRFSEPHCAVSRWRLAQSTQICFVALLLPPLCVRSTQTNQPSQAPLALLRPIFLPPLMRDAWALHMRAEREQRRRLLLVLLLCVCAGATRLLPRMTAMAQPAAMKLGQTHTHKHTQKGREGDSAQ